METIKVEMSEKRSLRAHCVTCEYIFYPQLLNSPQRSTDGNILWFNAKDMEIVLNQESTGMLCPNPDCSNSKQHNKHWRVREVVW